jgi:hypothetical protein
MLYPEFLASVEVTRPSTGIGAHAMLVRSQMTWTGIALVLSLLTLVVAGPGMLVGFLAGHPDWGVSVSALIAVLLSGAKLLTWMLGW